MTTIMKNYKQLYIVRHGKSSWEYDNVDDIDRPLKTRGINDAYKMAERLDIRNKYPQEIYSSPATRAMHTSLIFARTLNYPLRNLRVEDILYNGSLKEIMDFIKSIDNSITSVMIFGHNPNFTDLANEFLKEQIDNLPTSGIASLNFKVEKWEDISRKNASTELVDYPKKKFEN